MIGVLRSVPAEDDRADGVPERPQPTLVDVPMLIDESRMAGMRVELECEVTDLGAVPEAVGRTRVPDRAGGAHQRPQACRPRRRVSGRCGGRRPTASPSRSAILGRWGSRHDADPGRGYGPHRARRADRSHRRAAGARPHPGRRIPAVDMAAVADMTGSVRVMVVEDDPLVRAAIAMILGSRAGRRRGGRGG